MHENQHEEDGMTDHERQAFELGVDAAKAAASWVLDGNYSQDHYRRMVEMFDAGDPEVYDYLPASPNLSGEWADAPTPHSLARDIIDWTADDDELGSTVVEEIADAYELGVSETFADECERLIRSALES